MTKSSDAWLKIIVRCLLGLVITVLLFIGREVIANDRASRQRDEDIENHVDDVEMDVKGLQVDIRYIKEASKRQEIRQEKMMKQLAKLGR